MSQQPAVAKKTMRDAFLERVLQSLDNKEKVFFLTADLGAPALDAIRSRHPDRCINVGIAEQNLINVAAGLGLEGYTVFAYAIAPFVTMRCFEQIRVNLAVLSQLRPMNVNVIGVGAGMSYDVSGPTHHCLEDISIMRTLPNVEVLSPADWTTARELYPYVTGKVGVKYLRFDAKPLPAVYENVKREDIEAGFIVRERGSKVALITTGFMTHKANDLLAGIRSRGISPGMIDLINLNRFNSGALWGELKKYQRILTIEEGFIGKGGLDAAISHLLRSFDSSQALRSFGIEDQYLFHIGSREQLHHKHGINLEQIVLSATA